ncbi:DNA polymerase III subunit beta [Micrococcales bacterium 31B]|nr:DNA polymerase III subunit beta [Micrococcales bacterium 31B]
MKFQLDRDVLADVVNWVARTLPARPPMPVLSGLLLAADDMGTLTISSFDYEVSARMEVAAEVHEPGTALVSGRLLADISRALPAKPVHFELEGGKITLNCGTSRFTLATMPVEEYPALPLMPEASGSIDAKVFTDAISQVSIATSKDDTLPLLTGIFVEIQGEKITMLATDRYRLAVRELNWVPADPSFESTAVVRGRTLTEVSKSLGGGEPVTVALTSGQGRDLIGFQAGGRRTTSLLVEGKYPDVRQLFPKDAPISAVVNAKELADAVKRVSLVAERSTQVRLAFADGHVVLEAGAGDDAQASETLEASIEGEDIVVAFNPAFLLDGLGALGTAYAKFALTNQVKPVILTPLAKLEGANDHEDSNYRYLLMPIRHTN